MEQLIEIQTVPLVLEYKTQDAKLDYSAVKPSYDMTRVNGTLEISHQYPRLHIDTTELRNSMNLKTPSRFAQDNAEAGMQAAMEATSRIAEEGNAIMNTQDGMNFATLIFNNTMQEYQNSMDCTMAAMPSVPADVSWDPGQFSLQYSADKLVFDWNTQKAEAKFVPANIEFQVKQYAKIEFIYHGKPVYVPPSASPDYQPKKMDISA